MVGVAWFIFFGKDYANGTVSCFLLPLNPGFRITKAKNPSEREEAGHPSVSKFPVVFGMDFADYAVFVVVIQIDDPVGNIKDSSKFKEYLTILVLFANPHKCKGVRRIGDVGSLVSLETRKDAGRSVWLFQLLQYFV